MASIWGSRSNPRRTHKEIRHVAADSPNPASHPNLDNRYGARYLPRSSIVFARLIPGMQQSLPFSTAAAANNSYTELMDSFVGVEEEQLSLEGSHVQLVIGQS